MVMNSVMLVALLMKIKEGRQEERGPGSEQLLTSVKEKHSGQQH